MFDQVSDSARPAIVLVHGAWADASCWNGVITQLQAAGYTVYAPPNPLRSLAADAAGLAAFVTAIPGRVILVGHSYGGAVISVASPSTPNVKGSSTSMDSHRTPGRVVSAFCLRARRRPQTYLLRFR